MNRIKLDCAMCMECDWEGKLSECEWDLDYDDFNFRHYKYPICPKCGGGVELSSKGADNIVSLEDYIKLEEDKVNEEIEEYFRDEYYEHIKELTENHKPGL